MTHTPLRYPFAAVALIAAAWVGNAAAATGAPAHAPVAAASAPAHATTALKQRGPTVPARLIDINSASKAELKTLPGIGDAQAQRIIAGRPYLTKEDLVSSKAIPAGTFVAIKRAIVAKPVGNKPAVKR